MADDAALPSTGTLEERAKAVRLHPTERRILEHLLSIAPYELGTMTSSDISERSGASRSTIDRLSRKLGFGGLKDMRKALLFEVGRRGKAAQPQQGDASAEADIARRVMRAMAERADAFATALSLGGELRRCVTLLRSARAVQLFGVGESAAVCNAIHMRLVRLGLPIDFSDEFHTQVTLAALMQPGDLAIAISHSGRTRATYQTVKVARDRGATVVLVSGKPDSPLARLSDLVLPLPGGPRSGSSEVIDRTLMFGLAEILYQCLAADNEDLLANSMRIDDAFDMDRLQR